MIIYCDMDGVLCDFERQWARVNKLPFSKFSSLNMHDRWEKLDSMVVIGKQYHGKVMVEHYGTTSKNMM